MLWYTVFPSFVTKQHCFYKTYVPIFKYNLPSALLEYLDKFKLFGGQ